MCINNNTDNQLKAGHNAEAKVLYDRALIFPNKNLDYLLIYCDEPARMTMSCYKIVEICITFNHLKIMN